MVRPYWLALALASLLLAPLTSDGQPLPKLTWSRTDPATGATLGGSGTWTSSATVLNWWDTSSTAVPWDGSSDAVFGTTPGAVTIDAAGVTARGLTFVVTGYTVDGPGALTMDSAMTPITVGPAASVSTTITAALHGSAGSVGLLKLSLGNLALTNTSNDYGGGTLIRSGRISVGGDVLVTGSASPLGTGSIQLGDGTSGNTDAMALYLTGSHTLSRDITTGAGGANASFVNTARYFVGVDAAGASATLNGNFTWGGAGVPGTGLARQAALSAIQSDAALTVNGKLTTGSGGGLLTINGTTSPVPAIGTVKLTNTDNAISAGLTVARGTLVVGAAVTAAAGNSAVGTGGVTLADSTTAASAVSLLTDGAFTFNRPITLSTTTAGYVIGTTAPTGTADFQGDITPPTSTANVKLQLTAAAGGTAAFSGLIKPNTNGTGVLNVEKVGAGTVVLSRPDGNTYDGTTTVTAGTLLANNTNPSFSATGAGAVTVKSSARLGGGDSGAPGFVSTRGFIAGNVIVEGGGTLAPGSSVGTLSGGGSVTFQDSAVLAVELGSANVRSLDMGVPQDVNTNDRLKATGTINFGSTLTLAIDGGGQSFTSHQTYDFFIASAGTTLGAFESATVTFNPTNFATPAGSGEFMLSRVNGNSLILTFTPVPEPTTVLAILMGGVAFDWVRRRARKSPRGAKSAEPE